MTVCCVVTPNKLGPMDEGSLVSSGYKGMHRRTMLKEQCLQLKNEISCPRMGVMQVQGPNQSMPNQEYYQESDESWRES